MKKEPEEESLSEKKVGFETNQKNEDNKSNESKDSKEKKGGRSSNGYELKIAVSQKQYPANKKNSSHYSFWSFIPVNLYHQILNPVFQFYLLIMILEVIPWVSVTNGIPNTFLPYSVVIVVQMIVDYFISFKVNNLDWVQKSLKVKKV